jgi:glycosyltransferase involved in cell wall biosynthesis
MAELAATVEKAADALGLDRFELMGTSFGGKAALWLAVQHPERVRALVLEAPAAIRPQNAMAGTASVAGTPEQIQDGETGLLVPPANPEAIADAIMRLLDASPAERSAMGERARERVSETFTTARMVRETAALYGELLGKS